MVHQAQRQHFSGVPAYLPWESHPPALDKGHRHFCPSCGASSEGATTLAERGYYERTTLKRCTCGQKFEVYG